MRHKVYLKIGIIYEGAATLIKRAHKTLLFRYQTFSTLKMFKEFIWDGHSRYKFDCKLTTINGMRLFT